jgi:hypothetical protein
VNLWWVRNDGIAGHVWLGPGDLVALRDEMLAQGMAWEDPERGSGIPLRKLATAEEVVITTAEVEEALERASTGPRTLADPSFWRDWLAFLEGASARGGIVVRP